MRGFDGKVAIVTGAAGGIGRATAIRLADEGATVICADLPSAALGEIETTLRDRGVRVGVAAFDVRDPDSVADSFDEIAEVHGGIHVLINAHGVYHQGTSEQGPVEADSREDWDAILAVNLLGVVNTCRAALPYMKRQRFGRIVSLSSAAAVVGGYACSAAYAVSKAGVTCFMKCVAREGARFGITANSVAPGQIDTPMTAVVLERVPLSSIVERTPLGRLGDPAEVASAAVFLSSDDASFITGQMIGVNGGMLMV